LSGDPLKPLLIWLALGLPLVFLTSNPPLVFLHTVGMACAVFTGAFTTGTWFTLVQPDMNWRNELVVDWSQVLRDDGLPFLAVVLFWCLILRQTRTFLGNKSKLLALFALLFFLWALYLNNTPLYTDGNLYFL